MTSACKLEAGFSTASFTILFGELSRCSKQNTSPTLYVICLRATLLYRDRQAVTVQDCHGFGFADCVVLHKCVGQAFDRRPLGAHRLQPQRVGARKPRHIHVFERDKWGADFEHCQERPIQRDGGGTGHGRGLDGQVQHRAQLFELFGFEVRPKADVADPDELRQSVRKPAPRRNKRRGVWHGCELARPLSQFSVKWIALQGCEHVIRGFKASADSRG